MLDNTPVATPVFLAGLVLIILAYLGDELSALEAFAALGLDGVGSAAIGEVRNRAGRGTR